MEDEPDVISNEGPVTNDDEDVVFVFYYNLVKRMILKLQDVEYICRLTSWLKALENNKNKTVRNEYIRLMVSVLQNADQLCPFKEYPPETIDPLQNDIFEKAKKLRQGDGTATCAGFNEANNLREPYPTISTAVSQDKCQYAACQVIPNVGVQCYFAFSDDHLYNWTIPSAISVPVEGPHTRDVDWERAMAGIHLKRTNNSPSAENLESETAKTVKVDKEPKENDESEMCKVMFIEQQIRGVTEVFEWNDASLLTGEIILGAEMGSDRKVNAQVKTQSELDREVGNCFDKLYPGDFRIQANPSFLSDIIHQKTNDSETETTREQQCEEKCKQIQQENRAERTCAGGGSGGGGGTRNAPSNVRRQEAGQENTAVITALDENVFNDGRVDLRRKIFDISTDLAVLNHSLESKYHKLSKNRRQDDPTAACSQTGTADSGTDDVPNRKVENNRDERPTADSKLRTDLLDFQRQIKMAEDCRNKVQKSLSGNNNPNCKNPSNIDHCDSNETPSDASIQQNI